MAFSGGQVDQAAFAEQVDFAAVGHGVLFDEGFQSAFGFGGGFKRRYIDLDVEMAGVGQDGAVLHDGEISGVDDVLIAGDGDEDIADFGGVAHRHDGEAVHDRFQRPNRFYLCDDDIGAHAAGAQGDAVAAPAVAGDDDFLAGPQDIGGPGDAVKGALAGAVAVIEEVLGLGVVDGDDRVFQRPGGGHGPETDDACRRLLGAADDFTQQLGALGMQNSHQVGAVVHGQLRLDVEGGHDMFVIGLIILALDGVGGNAVYGQRRGDVVLGGQRIGAAQHQVGAAGFQSKARLAVSDGDMETGGDADALERLLFLEALGDEFQDGHFPPGPGDAFLTESGERGVFDIGGDCHVLPFFR